MNEAEAKLDPSLKFAVNTGKRIALQELLREIAISDLQKISEVKGFIYNMLEDIAGD